MKNLCTAALFFILSGHGLNAQQNLSTMKVSFETGKTTANEAVKKFLSQHVKEYAYSSEELKNYSVPATKCKNEPVIDCLNKLLKEVPVEVLIFNNSVVIRQKKSKSISSTITPLKTSLIGKDTLQDINKIDEIVVNAGYYNVKEKERTGSISKVTAQDIENQPVTNVLSSLQGRMSGVNITQNSGIPGGGFTIQIRGQNSLRTSMNSAIDCKFQ